MQVSVESLSSIEKKLTISFPLANITEEVQKRLHNLAPKVKIPGFRPGKVPFNVIEKRYLGSVRQEVLDDKIKESYFAALEKEEIRPVGMPKIDVVQGKLDLDANATSSEADSFTYSAIIEIYPTIELADLSQISVEKFNSTVNDADVSDMIMRMRRQEAEWVDVSANAEHKIQYGDKILVDFTVKVHSEMPKEEQENDVKFEIGAGEMWPEFEAPLIGKTVGDDLVFTLTFPDTHMDKEVAGKTADFIVKIKVAWEVKLPELDDAFALKHGVKEGGVEALRATVRKSMEEELERILQKHLNDSIVDKVVAAHSFEVPKAFVEAEITRRQEQMQSEFKKYFGDKKLPQEFPRQNFAEVAKKSVAIGMIFSELATARDIKIDAQQIRADIEKRLAGYDDEHKETLINWFCNDENRAKHIEAELLEREIFEHIKKQIKITEKQIDYKEASALRK